MGKGYSRKVCKVTPIYRHRVPFAKYRGDHPELYAPYSFDHTEQFRLLPDAFN